MNWDATKRLAHARDGGKCVRCLGVAQDCHHRRVRGMGGSQDPAVTALANVVCLCRACHDYIHAHPAESYASGFLVHAGQDPAEVPVLVKRGSWLKLTADGNAERVGACAIF